MRNTNWKNLTLEEKEDVICQKARFDLIAFSQVTNKEYNPGWHHKVIAEELEQAEQNNVDWKILILMMPPRHGKSEEASINFPAWYLGRNPNKRII